MFDCSLASTMGYTAAALIQHKLTGMVVTVDNVTASAGDWRCGGVPIIGLMDVIPREGFRKTDLVVPSENVEMKAKTF